MAASILVTKLFVPPTRAEFVHRSGLIERLNNGLNRRLTLLSAPAGFGKTTLVSHWVEHIKSNNKIDGQPIKVVWLSLDQDDNDPVRFLTYFIAALNQSKDIETDIGQGALNLLQSPQPPPPNTVLISLINELAAIPEKVVFVLDDYHLIESKQIHQALVFLLENLPSQLHVVIATRQDPSLSLGRLRARDQLTELRAVDLRFTSSEIADFLNQVMGLNLSSEDIAELETRTEGWIAGLQLAAISMRGREDYTGFIKSFTGGHRLVLDFLIEEVLGLQPESVQNFLLQTAILDRMTGSLCDAFTGQENGQETLEMLDHANLFIVPLDEERCWYRYHHLFGDLLRQRLRQTQAEQLKELHDKASEWYKLNGLIDQAIEHALKSEDFDQAAYLIQSQIDVLWQRGEHGKLRRWVQALPEELLITEPQLGIIRAYYLHTIGEYISAEQLLQSIERILDPHGNGDEVIPSLEYKHLLEIERLKLRGRLSSIRALIYSFDGNVKEIIKQANRALEFLPEQDLTWRNFSGFALGDAHSYLGDMAASYDARFTTLRACEAEGNIFYIILAALKLATTLREQGELYRTRDLCNDQVRLAEKNNLAEINMVGCIRTILGEVLAEFNDLERAIQHARQGVKIAEGGQNLVFLSMSYLYLMRVLFSKKDLEGAKEVFDKVLRLERDMTIPIWLSSQMATWQVKFWLLQEDLEAVSNWADKRGILVCGDQHTHESIDHLSMIDHIVYARVLFAQDRMEETIQLLRHLYKTAERSGRISRSIEIKMLQALAYQSTGQTEQAMESFEHVLNLAEPKGFIRIFVDEGQPMASLLYEALKREITPEYVQRLLAAFPVTEPEGVTSTKSQVDQSGLIEPLSEREIEVLQFIAKGLTNQEISNKLFLSMHTIKTHTRNIYSKLGAHHRAEAVAKARAFGIL